MKNRTLQRILLAVLLPLFLLAPVVPLLADDYRINGYGNQPVNLYSTRTTHNGNAVDIPTVNLGSGSSVAIATGADAGALAGNSAAYEASHVIKASAGTLIALVGYNSKASAQWIQIYNSATVPADTAVPFMSFTVAATSNFSVTIPITGLPCTTGISWANSSTGPTKTLGSADVFATWIYK